MRRIFEFVLVHVTMPGTWSVYTDPAATCNVHQARGRGGGIGGHAGGLGELCGVPRGLCGRHARKTPELQLFTSAGGGNEVQTNGNEQKRERERETEKEKERRVHMCTVVGGQGRTFACLRAGSAQLAVTNGRHRRRRKKFRSRVLRECT